MEISKLGSVAAAAPAGSPESSSQSFSSVLDSVGRSKRGSAGPSRGAPQPHEVSARQRAEGSLGAPRQQPPEPGRRASGAEPMGHRVVDQLLQAQRRLDHVLELAQQGKSFTPAELLSLQAQVYRSSQELDLAGKVLDKASGGLKQVLQTQL
jgi:hypothetical protein